MARVLNLGAGLDRSIPGAVTVDLVAKTNPDVVHDLDVYPWPFETDSFDQVICREVIEHLEDVIKAMEEMHRITRPGGIVHIEGEEWTAETATGEVLPSGTPIRIVGVDGLRLLVEKTGDDRAAVL